MTGAVQLCQLEGVVNVLEENWNSNGRDRGINSSAMEVFKLFLQGSSSTCSIFQRVISLITSNLNQLWLESNDFIEHPLACLSSYLTSNERLCLN
jgi:hypothetical protein